MEDQLQGDKQANRSKSGNRPLRENQDTDYYGQNPGDDRPGCSYWYDAKDPLQRKYASRLFRRGGFCAAHAK